MSEARFTNELIHESSPYLLQHAHNPVNWYPWSDAALRKAKDENKLLLISIGYSACHWCHVMERESFEDEEVAAIMNELFVCIKIDREERPDIDQIYMEAVQLMSGHGGWPLNCFALPDQRPVYGGTYFRKEDFKSILLNLSEYWKNQPAEAVSYAEKLKEGIGESGLFEAPILSDKESAGLNFSENFFQKLISSWTGHIDKKRGGFGNSPKFPLPNCWVFLLRYAVLKNDEQLLSWVNLTLSQMGFGGIYDQLGGGFSRYSTDGNWMVPHFEKMLYDNSQLISLYSEAFQETQNPLYKKIVEESLEFIKRDLSSSDGGFYSALDADSEGVEGKYYLWSKQQLSSLLGAEEQIFSMYYHVKAEGNWEGSNILFRNGQDEVLASSLGLTDAELQRSLKQCKTRLMIERARRIPPGLDDKMLCSWNALMVKAYSDAYRVFRKTEYLDQARKSLLFLLTKFTRGDQLFRTYKNGRAKISAFLDDYVFLSEALMEVYQADFDSSRLLEAEKWMDLAILRFYDEEKGMFFYTSSQDEQLIARKQEVYDNVIPSSNSTAARVLLRLGKFLDRDDFLAISKRMLSAVSEQMTSYAPSFSNWSTLLLEWTEGITEIAVCGRDAFKVMGEFSELHLPFSIFLASDQPDEQLPLLKGKFPVNEEETLIFVCKNKTCQLPVTRISEALELF